MSWFGRYGLNFGLFSNPSSPRDQKLPKYYLLFSNICLQKSFLGWKKLRNMKIWKFGKEENFLSQLGNGHFTTFFGFNNFSKSKYIWGDGESWIWTEWTPKKALMDVKMSRKWPKLLFQPLRPPGASGGVNIENKSVQPVYIHTITPYFGQKSGFWMHLRGYLIGTTLPGHCEPASKAMVSKM